LSTFHQRATRKSRDSNLVLSGTGKALARPRRLVENIVRQAAFGEARVYLSFCAGKIGRETRLNTDFSDLAFTGARKLTISSRGSVAEGPGYPLWVFNRESDPKNSIHLSGATLAPVAVLSER
jgi:hypothetical protein